MAQRLRLVIADDEPLTRMNLKEALVDLRYLVIGEANDGVSTINLARSLRPDLVILDIRMPGIDGIQAARVLTEERIAPVLLLTAYADPELVDQAREAGVAAYLVKPFRDVDLRPAIEIALARYAEFREIEQQVQNLKEALETRKFVERAKGVLMAKHGLTEDQAYHKIRQVSMETRRPMREVAQVILLNQQIEE
jgi:two-component system, response regulator PdtaR